MTQQQASLTLALSRPELERRLADATDWSHFLVDVESVVKTGHERYRFQLVNGQVVPVAVHFLPRTHTFTWHALTAVPFDGALHLTEVGPACTRVTLHLTTRPAGAMANFLEMIMPASSRATIDLLWLDTYVHASSR